MSEGLPSAGLKLSNKINIYIVVCLKGLVGEWCWKMSLAYLVTY